MEKGRKTFCVFVDLQKAFDTVNKRLLWARLRSLGVAGKLLRALRAGYGKRTLIGKLGRGRSEERPDIGRGKIGEPRYVRSCGTHVQMLVQSSVHGTKYAGREGGKWMSNNGRGAKPLVTG